METLAHHRLPPAVTRADIEDHPARDGFRPESIQSAGEPRPGRRWWAQRETRAGAALRHHPQVSRRSSGRAPWRSCRAARGHRQKPFSSSVRGDATAGQRAPDSEQDTQPLPEPTAKPRARRLRSSAAAGHGFAARNRVLDRSRPGVRSPAAQSLAIVRPLPLNKSPSRQSCKPARRNSRLASWCSQAAWAS